MDPLTKNSQKEETIMAKKIRLDFSKVEERSGWNTRQIPEGLYKATVAAVQETEAQDGTAMLVYAFVPTDSKYKSRRFPYYCKLQQNQLWKLRDLLVAAGVDVPKKAQQIDPAKIVGATVAIEVEDDSYNGQVRSQVQGVYKTDILEDDDDVTDEDDEEYDDEEEYEDEEFDDADEEEYEDDEDEVDDDEEELDEDEEDDLDEDDLEDEDLDDEELYDDEDEEDEEPEPAPKRRAPAKKAPAKAAPKKAPAKRTVRRR
ncbi:hypothetical protein FDJ44_gp32 [Microbacterium phage Pikmin]|uniref:Uncharacterized protein n=3 Tax=Pikminvirus pikmin TaxID=2560596 RepID=A0A2P1CKM0_9CAUD|nr:hypothetical protein FDJ44_gp32 [Microbacterium phage Pikmin]AVJ51023.1 hypothetical protein PBI_PAJAZA_32 [Microbacterium phage Pajaza]AVJ51170.1 hypothetical protein PBI_PIKMIN_32 [Microbacterium phage Pikmin]AVJ51728.1 hypothetical protein PBI_CASEY_32 [Microbacterium phage Casey]